MCHAHPRPSFVLLILGLLTAGIPCIGQNRLAPRRRVQNVRPLTVIPGKTPLMQAAEAGKFAEVKRLCEQGSDVEAQDSEGRTALLWAVIGSYNAIGDVFMGGVEEAHQKVAEYLLAHGAKIDRQSKDGMTPLMRASGWHQYRIADALLAHGADIHLRDRWGRSALTWAARDGLRDDLVKALLKKGAEVGLTEALLLHDSAQAKVRLKSDGDLRIRGPYRETPLMIAAENGEAEIAEALLQQGVPLNEQDEKGMTALLLAVAGRATTYIPSGHTTWRKDRHAERLKVVDSLLKRGADPNLASYSDPAHPFLRKGGNTPLMQSVSQEDSEMVRRLLTPRTKLEAKDSEGNTALLLAASEKKGEGALLLLKAGADANAHNRFGDTPLIVAAASGSLPVLKALLQRGANVNAANQAGETALIRASSPDVTQELLKHGAKVTKTRDGYSALTIALWQQAGWQRDRQVIRQLRTAGAPVGLLDAVLLDDLALVKKRLAISGSLNVKGPNGLSPLALAVEYSRPEIVEVLLAHGAKPNERQAFLGTTPLIATVERLNIRIEQGQVLASQRAKEEARCVKIVQILLSHGAAVNAIDEYPQRSALMYAAETGLVSVVRLLLAHHARTDFRDNEKKTALTLAKDRTVISLLKQAGAKK